MALATTDIVNSVGSQDAVGTAKTIDLPETSVLAGDMMCIGMSFNVSGSDADDEVDTPTDWNKTFATGVLPPDTTSTPRLYFYWREVPGGGLGASVDFNVTSSVSNLMGVAFAVRDADVTALDVTATGSGTSASLDFPTATATQTGGLTIRVGVVDAASESSQAAITDHVTVDTWQENNLSNGAGLFVWAEPQAGTAVGTASATITSEQWATATIVIADVNYGGGASIIPQAMHHYRQRRD